MTSKKTKRTLERKERAMENLLQITTVLTDNTVQHLITGPLIIDGLSVNNERWIGVLFVSYIDISYS